MSRQISKTTIESTRQPTLGSVKPAQKSVVSSRFQSSPQKSVGYKQTSFLGNNVRTGKSSFDNEVGKEVREQRIEKSSQKAIRVTSDGEDKETSRHLETSTGPLCTYLDIGKGLVDGLNKPKSEMIKSLKNPKSMSAGEQACRKQVVERHLSVVEAMELLELNADSEFVNQVVDQLFQRNIVQPTSEIEAWIHLSPDMALNALLQGHEDVNSILVPDYIQSAPDVVRRRICALKKLQLQTVSVQADFYRRVHELETEFRSRFEAVNQQREKIVNGKYEPAENESDVQLFSWMDADEAAKFNENVTASGDGGPKGIPDFWLNTLKSVPGVADMITESDEDVLRSLTDITVEQVNEPASFTLKFHFAPNAYFNDAVLTKYYKLSIGPNGLENEVLYDGPSIIATKGFQIKWKEGKNVTEKTIKKKQKKGAQAGKTITKVVSNDSFFRFFSPEVEKVEKDMPEEVAEQINADFEAGQMIRDTVVDAAVLYFTGESVDDDDYDFDGDGEDEDDHEHPGIESDDEE